MGQRVSHTDGLSFFTGVEVSRTGIEVVDTVVVFLGTHLEEHGFKLADKLHIAIDTQQSVFTVDLFLFGKSLIVLVEFDLAQIDDPGLADLFGVNKLTFRHFSFSFMLG